MSRYNRFGKIYTDVMALYPGTVVTDYDAGGSAGQTKIEGAMDRASFEVAASLSPEVYKALTSVNAQEVVGYATANLASWTLGMIPIVAGSLHLWIYPLLTPDGARWPRSFMNSDWYLPPSKGFNEVNTADYNVVAATGVVTYTGRAINAGERIYASYDVDVNNAAFSVPMLGQVLMLGAAAELGEVLYTQNTQEWALVTQYRDRYKDLLSQLKDGSLVPDEIRALTYFTEIERENSTVSSIRLFRG